MRASFAATILILVPGIAGLADTVRLNGFLIDDPLVPPGAIEKGGPPRDGIPAIDDPRFVAADRVDFLEPDDRVLGISLGGRAKAYPVRILNRHEIVNDWINQEPVVITWCPLCGSGVAFSGSVDDTNLTFGVSGLLYNSDVLLYDRQTDSLWSQIAMKAVNGEMKGEELSQLPIRHTSWQDWKERHPHSRVLSTETGFPFIDYDENPYAGYERSNRLWFSVSNDDKRLKRKEWVLGVTVGDTAKAYPLDALGKTAVPVIDRIGDTSITIDYDREHSTAVVFDESGEPIPSIQLFWFAWAAFHPQTEVWNCAPGARRC